MEDEDEDEDEDGIDHDDGDKEIMEDEETDFRIEAREGQVEFHGKMERASGYVHVRVRTEDFG